MRFQEDRFQVAVAKFLDMNNVLWFHPPLERSTSPRSGARLKAKGVKPGVPDVLIFEARGPYHGLAIELKIEKDKGFGKKGQRLKPQRSRVSDDQKKWIKALNDRGYKAEIVYNFDEFLKTYNTYFALHG